MEKKAYFNSNIIFLIFMGIIFIGILFFGINKIFFLEENLSEKERIFFKNQLKESFEICANPLNRDNSKLIIFEHNSFNSVCVLKENYLNNLNYNDPIEWENIKKGGHNIIFMKTLFDSSGNIINYNIVDSFSLDMEIPASDSSNHICWYDLENEGKIEINIICG